MERCDSEPIELMANRGTGAQCSFGRRRARGNGSTSRMAEAFQFDGEGRIREFWAHATDQDAIDEFWS